MRVTLGTPERVAVLWHQNIDFNTYEGMTVTGSPAVATSRAAPKPENELAVQGKVERKRTMAG